MDDGYISYIIITTMDEPYSTIANMVIDDRHIFEMNDYLIRAIWNDEIDQINNSIIENINEKMIGEQLIGTPVTVKVVHAKR